MGTMPPKAWKYWTRAWWNSWIKLSSVTEPNWTDHWDKRVLKKNKYIHIHFSDILLDMCHEVGIQCITILFAHTFVHCWVHLKVRNSYFNIMKKTGFVSCNMNAKCKPKNQDNQWIAYLYIVKVGNSFCLSIKNYFLISILFELADFIVYLETHLFIRNWLIRTRRMSQHL